MSDQQLSPLFSWRSAIASETGPENSTTRHILLTLSLHMSAKGNSCFPSLDTIATETGYAKETVSRHLKKAYQAGWIDRRARHDDSGQRVGTLYFATTPSGLIEDQQGLTEDQRGVDRGSTKDVNEDVNNKSAPAREEEHTPPSVQDVINYGQAQVGLGEEECRRFHNHYSAVEWLDPHGRRISNWKAKLANWKANANRWSNGGQDRDAESEGYADVWT